MAFGGFCPLPLRLGGNDPRDAFTAEQFSRLTADVLAMARVATFARGTCTVDGGLGTASFGFYAGLHGIGLVHAPAIAVLGVGAIRLTWNDAYTDAYQRAAATKIIHAKGSPHGAVAARVTATVSIWRQVDLLMFDAAGAPLDGTISFSVF